MLTVTKGYDIPQLQETANEIYCFSGTQKLCWNQFGAYNMTMLMPKGTVLIWTTYGGEPTRTRLVGTNVIRYCRPRYFGSPVFL